MQHSLYEDLEQLVTQLPHAWKRWKLIINPCCMRQGMTWCRVAVMRSWGRKQKVERGKGGSVALMLPPVKCLLPPSWSEALHNHRLRHRRRSTPKCSWFTVIKCSNSKGRSPSLLCTAQGTLRCKNTNRQRKRKSECKLNRAQTSNTNSLPYRPWTCLCSSLSGDTVYRRFYILIVPTVAVDSRVCHIYYHEIQHEDRIEERSTTNATTTKATTTKMAGWEEE